MISHSEDVLYAQVNEFISDGSYFKDVGKVLRNSCQG